MKIDWIHIPVYNTLMSVATGVGLLLIVTLGRTILLRRRFSSDGYSLAFGVVGVILFLMGLHMSLTWPLARIAPYDNIVFGEPSLAFGALLGAASFYLWRRGAVLEESLSPSLLQSNEQGADYLARLVLPISLFVAILGLACFSIAAAGWSYTLWSAPPQEPISGNFANHPLVEATFISMLYVCVGMGSMLLPILLLTKKRVIGVTIGVFWTLAGLGFTVFGALNYYTHIGLIIHTS